MSKHITLWHQGSTPLVIPNCGGLNKTCPQSKRIAYEYSRGFFTLTNVIAPYYEVDDLGYETAEKKELAKVQVGDYIWLVVVPPMHRVREVFAYNDTVLVESSSLTSMDGITLSLVTATTNGTDADGNCDLQNITEVASLVFSNGEQKFVQVDNDRVLDTKTWLTVGFKVDALPKDTTLADITGRIAAGVHCWDYQAQVFM